MNRPFAVVLLASLLAGTAWSQLPGQLRRDRLRGELEVQRQQIGEQRVLRQTEVMRLEQVIERLETRISRLERRLISDSRLPAPTIREAEAALRLANARLKHTAELSKNGEATELQIATDQFSVIQAESQLEVAKAAHNENLLILQLDVIDAQRRLNYETTQHNQLERMAARGFTSSDGLKYQQLAVDRAQNLLQHARLRLETEKKSPPLSGASGEAVDPESEPRGVDESASQ